MIQETPAPPPPLSSLPPKEVNKVTPVKASKASKQKKEKVIFVAPVIVKDEAKYPVEILLKIKPASKRSGLL